MTAHPDDVHSLGGGDAPPCAGFASGALPVAKSLHETESQQAGVSTNNALSPISQKDVPAADKTQCRWFVLRTTYGREKKAYEYMVSKGVTAFWPTMKVVKLVNGKRRNITVSRLPNIFFAYGSEEQIKSFVYDNVNLPYLRFYYSHTRIGSRVEKTPLTVPDSQMDNLRIICEADAADIIVSSGAIHKFETGQLVRVVEGSFTGVVGRVSRYHGQQRVAVVVDGLVTACTAYVPSAFLERIEE